MKILHTSDWHLGRALFNRKRHEEFAAFLDWLAGTIEQNGVDALLVAGDIFDTGTPGNQAQALYYRFLRRVAASSCRHVVIIAGNHDSPSFLDAPGELLKAFDVHVIGSVSDENEVLSLCDAQGALELIVCAVPYLRDRDIRVSEAGESADDRQRKLIEGIRRHYAAQGALAEQKRVASGADVPIVGMGHLFAEGGRTAEGDGVRELYVGSLARVPSGVFPACFDYTALGHLHVPQTVGAENVRYSGSPLAVGFGEAAQQKSVCLVEFAASRAASIRLIDVPAFQALEAIQGDWERLSTRLAELAASGSTAWLEVTCTDKELLADLPARLDALIEGTRMEILRIKNTRVDAHGLRQRAGETLDDLDVHEVFLRCLNAHEIPETSRTELLRAYQETLLSLDEENP